MIFLVLYRSIRVGQDQANHQFSLPVEQSCHDDDEEESNVRPKPLVILIAGSGRSGTTYLFNLLRILLRQRDPNTISGWYEDLLYATRYASPPVENNGQEYGLLDSMRATGTTLLIKVHALGHATSLFTGCDKDFHSDSCLIDHVFLTHRDLAPQVNSLRRMNWARRKTKVSTTSFCFERDSNKEPRLVEKDWESPETWRIQAKAIAVCHGAWKNTAGRKLALDIGMESLVGDQDERIQLANDIIRKLDDPTTTTTTTMDAVAAVKEADALRPLDCASHLAVNPATHFHRGHVSATNSNEIQDESKRRGYDVIAADADLDRWRRAHGYVH